MSPPVLALTYINVIFIWISYIILYLYSFHMQSVSCLLFASFMTIWVISMGRDIMDSLLPLVAQTHSNAKYKIDIIYVCCFHICDKLFIYVLFPYLWHIIYVCCFHICDMLFICWLFSYLWNIIYVCVVFISVAYYLYVCCFHICDILVTFVLPYLWHIIYVCVVFISLTYYLYVCCFHICGILFMCVLFSYLAYYLCLCCFNICGILFMGVLFAYVWHIIHVFVVFISVTYYLYVGCFISVAYCLCVGCFHIIKWRKKIPHYRNNSKIKYQKRRNRKTDTAKTQKDDRSFYWLGTET